jgi:hypothetical protein
MSKFDLISIIPQKIPLFTNEKYFSLFESILTEQHTLISHSPREENITTTKRTFPLFRQAHSSSKRNSLWNLIKKSINTLSSHHSKCPEIVYKYLHLKSKKVIESLKLIVYKTTYYISIELVLKLYLYLSKQAILKQNTKANIYITNSEKEMILKINENTEKIEDLYKTKSKVTNFFLSKVVDCSFVINKYDKYHEMYVHKYEESNLGNSFFYKPKHRFLPIIQKRPKKMSEDINIKSHLSYIPSFIMRDKSSRKFSCDQIKNEVVTSSKYVNKHKCVHRTLSASNLIMEFPNKKRYSGKYYLTKKDLYY